MEYSDINQYSVINQYSIMERPLKIRHSGIYQQIYTYSPLAFFTKSEIVDEIEDTFIKPLGQPRVLVSQKHVRELKINYISVFDKTDKLFDRDYPS